MKKARILSGKCYFCQKKILRSRLCRRCRTRFNLRQQIYRQEERERQDVNTMEKLL